MNHGVLALESILSIGSLAVLVFWLRPDYCVDVFRERMGELRDALLDATPSNPLDPAIPAYDLLRRTVEGLIDRPGRLSLIALVVRLRAQPQPQPQSTSLYEKLEYHAMRLPMYRRLDLEGFYRRMNTILLGILFWPLSTRLAANPTIARGLDRLADTDR